jgi:hypothetical protein
LLWGGERVFARRGRSGSSWWREIVRIRKGAGEVGSVVRGVHLEEGGGQCRYFSLDSTDPLFDGISLRERFERLFNLAETKSRTVAKIYALGWDMGGETCVWRRQLRV